MSATTTISSSLNKDQVQTLMQGVTLEMLGIDSETDQNAYAKVRIAFQGQGQPVSSPDEDVVTLWAREVDEPYNRVRDVENATNDATTVRSTTTFTLGWEVSWIIYGPNSGRAANLIRSGLFKQDVHDELAGSNIYLIPDIAAPARVPETNDTGEWFERVDFSARFYEGVTEQEVVNAIGSTEVILKKQE